MADQEEDSTEKEEEGNSLSAEGTDCSEEEADDLGPERGGHCETGSSEKEEGESAPGPLEVTDLAISKIKEISAGENIDSYRLRVKVIGGGCAGFMYDLTFDESEEAVALPEDPVASTDLKFDIKGVTFVIDQMSLMYLRGTKIDFVETLLATGFKFDNPNTTTTCGCGSSFKP